MTPEEKARELADGPPWALIIGIAAALRLAEAQGIAKGIEEAARIFDWLAEAQLAYVKQERYREDREREMIEVHRLEEHAKRIRALLAQPGTKGDGG